LSASKAQAIKSVGVRTRYGHIIMLGYLGSSGSASASELSRENCRAALMPSRIRAVAHQSIAARSVARSMLSLSIQTTCRDPRAFSVSRFLKYVYDTQVKSGLALTIRMAFS
jgi:hypothetical protein